MQLLASEIRHINCEIYCRCVNVLFSFYRSADVERLGTTDLDNICLKNKMKPLFAALLSR